jgi:hypothetical protein
MEGFADEIGVSVDALRDWKDAKEEDGETLRYPDFHRAYMRAQGKQKQMLVINGLGGLYPPSFAIFVAQNFTEMRDKTAVDHTTQGKAMPAPQVYLPEDLPDEYFDKQKQDAEKAAADNPQR